MLTRYRMGIWGSLLVFALGGCGAHRALPRPPALFRSRSEPSAVASVTPWMVSAPASAPWGIPRAVQFLSPETGWAITGGAPAKSGSIMVTHNGGRSWQVHAVSGVTFEALQVSTAQTATAFGNQGPTLIIVHTTNGGATWQITRDPHPPFSAAYLQAVDALGSQWLILSASGKLWVSSDSGWRAVVTPHLQTVTAVAVQGETIAAILGTHRLMVTTNAGKTWQTLLTTPRSQTLAALVRQGPKLWVLEQTVLGSQTKNTLLEQPQPVASFTRIVTQTLPSAQAWKRITMVTSENGWAWGGTCDDILGDCATTLYTTTNGGHTWQPITLPTVRYHYPNTSAPSVDLTGFRPGGFFGTTQGVMAIGYLPPNVTAPVLFITTDGGRHWTPLSRNP